MKLEVGKEYRTRDGQKVMITEAADNGSDDCWGLTDDGKPLRWYCNGRYFSHKEHPLDLIAEWDAPAQGDGWIPWSGGKCPVSGHTVVEVRFRTKAKQSARADHYWWTHGELPGDIIAYRIAKPSYEGEPPVRFPEQGSNGDLAVAAASPSPTFDLTTSVLRHHSCALSCIYAALCVREGV